VFVTAPWGTFKYELNSGQWRNVVIRVPKSYRDSDFKLLLMTPDFWFPADHGSDDLRCLGCLVEVLGNGDPTTGHLGLIQCWVKSRHAKLAHIPMEYRSLDVDAWSEPAIVDGAGRFVHFQEVRSSAE
jgi:hypothetical protein